MIIEVDSTSDELRDYTSLTDVALRRKLETERGLYMAESTNVIKRALAAGHQPRSFLTSQRWLPLIEEDIAKACGASDGGETPIYVADEEILEQITGFHLHRGALAAMNRPELPDLATTLSEAHVVVVVEDLVDHTNVGAIFRSCAALGADAVIVTPQCADPLYRRSVRVSMGTVFQVPWTRMNTWPRDMTILKEHGFEVVALALDDDAVTLPQYCADLKADHKVALVLGAEGDGLSHRTIAHADQVVTIPMAPVVDSLNVAAASAVSVYAVQSAIGRLPHSKNQL